MDAGRAVALRGAGILGPEGKIGAVAPFPLEERVEVFAG
jgi:hypothetical protein